MASEKEPSVKEPSEKEQSGEAKSESDRKEELEEHIEEQMKNLDQHRSEEVGRTNSVVSLSRFTPFEDCQGINEQQKNMGDIRRSTIVLSSSD